MLFGGNLLRQPAFVSQAKENPASLRLAVNEMIGADQLMNQALFLGTYPGLSKEMIEREVNLISEFVEDHMFKSNSRSD